jgi:hypothetical protein
MSSTLPADLLTSPGFRALIAQVDADREAKRSTLARDLAALRKADEKPAAARRRALDDATAAELKAYDVYHAAITARVAAHQAWQTGDALAGSQARALEAELVRLADPRISAALRHIDAACETLSQSPGIPGATLDARMTRYNSARIAVEALTVRADVDVAAAIRSILADAGLPPAAA